MSGHSKWSQIKRQKGAADQKRGQIFSKLTNVIIVAARHGGADPNVNLQLRIAIEKARLANMPKENIDRAIKRGTGELGGVKIEEVLYEAIGPAGIGILIEAATDNKNRTNSQIKNVLGKSGAKLTGAGAVQYQFERMGKLLINFDGRDHQEIELIIIDAGAEDFEEQQDLIAVYTQPHELEKVKKNLEDQNITIREAGLSWEPKNLVKIEDKNLAEKILKLMESLDSLEEATNIYANFDIPEGLL